MFDGSVSNFWATYAKSDTQLSGTELLGFPKLV